MFDEETWLLMKCFQFCGCPSSQLPAQVAPSYQTCTNTRNTSIPPGVLSFKVVFVNKFNLMEDIPLLLFWPVSEGLDLISS